MSFGSFASNTQMGLKSPFYLNGPKTAAGHSTIKVA
jgi:hypothetical protein